MVGIMKKKWSSVFFTLNKSWDCLKLGVGLSIIPDCKSIFLYLSKPHRVYWFLFPASPQSYPFFGMTIRFAEWEGGLLYLLDFNIFLFWAVDTEIKGGCG